MQEMRVKWVPTSQVRPYPGNPRRNDAAVAPVAESLRKFGWRQPIVVDGDHHPDYVRRYWVDEHGVDVRWRAT